MMAPLTLAAALVTGQPIPINAALLGGLPEEEAVLAAHGASHRCSGPALEAVAGRLGAPQGEALRGKALAGGVLVTARDGYVVLFSLAELDATLGNEPAIIATHCDGVPLPPDIGPYRLVLPRDTRPARAVRQAVTIELVDMSSVTPGEASPSHNPPAPRP